MTISFAKRVVVPADVLVQELQGESVLLNLNSGRYYGLDDVGTRMWQVLVAAETIEDGYHVLSAEYDTDAERLRSDLEGLLEKLVANGLVQFAES
jgi:hypothetical protein